MSKKKDSEYYPGARTSEWIKIKITQMAECIIVGFTKRTVNSSAFRNLLLAIKDGKQLRYIGMVGTGFQQRTHKDILASWRESNNSIVWRRTSRESVP